MQYFNQLSPAYGYIVYDGVQLTSTSVLTMKRLTPVLRRWGMNIDEEGVKERVSLPNDFLIVFKSTTHHQRYKQA